MTITVGDFVELRGSEFNLRGQVLELIHDNMVVVQFYTKINRDDKTDVVPDLHKETRYIKALHKVNTVASKEDVNLMNRIYIDLALDTKDHKWLNECWNQLYGEVTIL